MRLQVLTDDSNEILGIVRPAEKQDSPAEKQDTPISSRLVPGRGQKLIEIEVPDELANARSPHEFHQWVRPFLPR
jgi:hypothetical protein